MEIREAGLGDLSGIVELHSRARVAYYGAGGLPTEEILTPELAREQREGWAAAITSARKQVRVAIVDGVLAGVLAMGPPHSSDLDPRTTAQLYQIHVDPGLWGRGVGGALHAMFVRHLADEGLVLGVLEVWERNIRARAFYTRHGWRPDGTSRPGPARTPYVGMQLTHP
ncbi:GNAT family N-acetyltransferase [Micromonospora sp. NBRC 110037]|uniref:GNAT family N-acetyltransferase n=1 Tax=Micromonospora TaxID=1873 RepID=UPI000A6A0B7E|nr:GNAT family N-acetyltransferase [Micromonospora sp. NBRC 110037]